APVIFSELALLAQHAAEVHEHAQERRKLHVEAGELPPDFPRPYLLWGELLGQGDELALVNLSNNEQGAEMVGWWGQDPAAAASPPPGAAPEFMPFPSTLFAAADLFGGQLRRLVDDILARLRDGERVVVVTPQAARIQEMIEEALKTKDERRTTKDDHPRPTQ